MKIERWGWYSIAVNILLALLHGFIAFRSDSLAVAAELTHNIVDLAAAVAVLIGLKLAGRKSKSFPYGLYKIENLVAAGLAALIVVNPHCTEARAKGIRVAEWLVAQKIDVVLSPEDVSKKGPAYVLREAGVQLRSTDKSTISEAILSAA